MGALSTDSIAGAPLVVYALARLGALGARRARMAAATACIPFVALVVTQVQNTPVLALALAICGLAALLALRTVQEEAARRSLHVVRDDLREKVLTLQDTNARLLQAQDYELRAAALAERTRIAREIHDGVGHLLTRLLLQVKALQVVHRDEPGVVADLATLDGGLGEALDSMRRSVHACPTTARSWPPPSTCWARAAASSRCAWTAPPRLSHRRRWRAASSPSFGRP